VEKAVDGATGAHAGQGFTGLHNDAAVRGTIHATPPRFPTDAQESRGKTSLGQRGRCGRSIVAPCH